MALAEIDCLLVLDNFTFIIALIFSNCKMDNEFGAYLIIDK